MQLAKLMRAEVTAVDSMEKLDMLRELGADHVIDFKREDFTKSGKTYDVIFAEAHRYVETGRKKGNVVLTMQDGIEP